VVNKILILLSALYILSSCKKSSSPKSVSIENLRSETSNHNASQDREHIFERISFTYDEKDTLWTWKIKANSGFLMIGCEYNIIAPGIVPDAIYNLDSINMEEIEINIDFEEVSHGSKLIYTVKFFGLKNKILGIHKFSRNWSALKFVAQPNDEFITRDRLHKLSFGKIGDDRVYLVPAVYFAKELNTLKDGIKISKSIPNWNWEIIDINNINVE